MKHFLELVADDLRAKSGNDLSRTIVIFPNKRACLFLNKYLVKDNLPVWSPQYMTISEFFTSLTNITVADPIETVIRLYKIYRELTGSDESIDYFYGWGERILADFDDLDKNLGNAEKIFCDMREYEEIGSETDFLTEEEMEQLRHFAKDFDTKHTEVRNRFHELWKNMLGLYNGLREELSKGNQAYEGQLYRYVAEGLKKGAIELPNDVDRIAFVGFNVLDKVEKELFSFLKDKGKAVFYWDYDTHYMQSGTGVPVEAGTFLKENLQSFPNALGEKDYFNNLTGREEEDKLRITYAEADTNAIQAQYVGNWLSDKDYKESDNTAIVLCDETMLQPVLYALPDTDDYKVNITKGYPLSHTPAYTFIARKLDEMLTARRIADSQRSEQGENIPPLTPGEIKEAFSRLRELVEETLRAEENTEKYTGKDSKNENWNYLLYTESYFQIFTTLTRFSHLIEQGELIGTDGNAVISLHTLFKLVRQVLRSITIPFHGEPAEGLQVMGVLETRCLDFDNLLLLSVNDGILPQKASDASFIPYLIRKRYGLTTAAKRTAVYAYYFFRLLQRAKNVTLVYNCSTSTSQKGEMSRFMKQMLIDPQFAGRIERIHLTSKPVPMPLTAEFNTNSPWKDGPAMTRFSPSALNTYINCKLKFFFKYIKHFDVPSESDNTIDQRDLGTVFHGTAELIYKESLSDKRERAFTPSQIAHFLDTSGDAALMQLIRLAIEKENKERSKPHKRGEFIKSSVLLESTVLHLIKQLLRYEANAANVAQTKLLATEYEASTTLKVPYGKEGDTKDIEIYGSIDRLDVQQTAGGNQHLRIIDYKTGGTPHDVKGFDKLFHDTPSHIADHAYIRQTFMYSLMMLDHPHNECPRDIPIQPQLYYVNRMSGNDFTPAISIDGKAVADFRQFADPFRKDLTALIAELISPDKNFDAEYDKGKCKFCEYTDLCRSICRPSDIGQNVKQKNEKESRRP